ncbi:MFS transporter [Bradyrhizobium sp. BR 1432]|uniref:MFS transporter n=1 Tax=Bradyrhizobium sp. BR 1432 TaxID=3447966 RepID=UPI003EE5337D
MKQPSAAETTTVDARPLDWVRDITPYQWRVFAVVWLGWILDSTDFGLFSFVLRPALSELLGSQANLAELGRIGGLLSMVGLLGWAIGGFVFGIVADYAGRLRTLAVSILIFSVFTGLQGLAQTPLQLGLFRFLAGVGAGAEIIVGIPLLAEALSGPYRAKITGIMMTGGAFGSLLGASVYGLLAPLGWRYVFAAGIAPALLLFLLRRGVAEPELFAAVQARRSRARLAGGSLSDADREFLRFVPMQLFGRKLIFNTIIGLMFCLGTLLSIWTSLIWLPTIQSLMLDKEAINGAEAIAIVSHNMQLWSIGGILGYATFGFIADRIGRRATIAFYNLGTLAVGLYLYFGVDHHALYPCLLPLFGYFVWGVFSGHAIYVPELFPTHVRATALSFCNGTGRIITSFGPLVAGLLVAPFGGNFSKAAGVMTCFALLSLLAVTIGRETRDDALPQ